MDRCGLNIPDGHKVELYLIIICPVHSIDIIFDKPVLNI